MPPRASLRPTFLQGRDLFAWAGDEDREDSDFLAVIDLARDGDRYGTIVTTTPVNEKGLWPHHTEHELRASKMLFAIGTNLRRRGVWRYRLERNQDNAVLARSP